MIWTEIGSIGTAVGAIAVAAELWFARSQAKSEFENELAREYRDIARSLPAHAFFKTPDPELPEIDGRSHLADFVRYIDLCNEQILLHRDGRISNDVWKEWEEGMLINFSRPAFEQAWSYVRTHNPDSYDELAELLPTPSIALAAAPGHELDEVTE